MKGVSQVLTSAIILAVGVAVAGVYSTWAPDFAGDITGQTADQTNSNIKCSNAGLSIETVRYDLSGNFTEVGLRNSGTIDLNQGVEVVLYNQSRIIARSTIESIEADNTFTERIDGDEIPERMAASSQDCPSELVVSTERIEVIE